MPIRRVHVGDQEIVDDSIPELSALKHFLLFSLISIAMYVLHAQ